MPFIPTSHTAFTPIMTPSAQYSAAATQDVDIRDFTRPAAAKLLRRKAVFRRQNDGYLTWLPATSTGAAPTTSLSPVSDEPIWPRPVFDPSEIIPTSRPSSTPMKPPGEEPLSNLAVQLTLGTLALLLLLSVCFRFCYVHRQHKSLLQQRQNPVTYLGTAPSAAFSMPTNEMTLAGRLQAYQEAAGPEYSRYRYPYQQEPQGGHLESVNSVVAPSYEQDVSPPPFAAETGKPPSYAEAFVP